MPGMLPVIVNDTSGSVHGEGTAAQIESRLRAAGAEPRLFVANGSRGWARSTRA